MLICLDYDRTYTKDPDFWIKFILLSKSYGHKVICCTKRTNEERKNMCEILTSSVPVYNSNRVSKMKYLLDIGIKPDIYIDDEPYDLFY